MKTCSDCKFAAMKGRFCAKFRKRTTPYYPSCGVGFEDLVVEKTPIPRVADLETNLMYILMSSAEFLIYDIDRLLKQVGSRFIEKKKNQLIKLKLAVDKAKEEFDKLQKDYTSQFDAKKYDMFLSDSFECIRLMMLYADKCGRNIDNMNKVFTFLRGLEGENIVTEDDLKRFNSKRINK